MNLKLPKKVDKITRLNDVKILNFYKKNNAVAVLVQDLRKGIYVFQTSKDYTIALKIESLMQEIQNNGWVSYAYSRLCKKIFK